MPTTYRFVPTNNFDIPATLDSKPKNSLQIARLLLVPIYIRFHLRFEFQTAVDHALH